MLRESPGHTDRVRRIYEDLLGRFPRSDLIRHAFANVGLIDTDVDGGPPTQAERSRSLLRRALGPASPDGGRLLDVGCGRGGNLHDMADRFGSAGSCFAVDLTDSGARAAATLLGADAAVLRSDAHTLPFADASFDLVTCVESAHAYLSPGDFHAEVARVAAPDGVFVLVDFVPAEAADVVVTALGSIGLDVTHHEDLTKGVLRSLDALDVELADIAARGALDDRARRYAATPGSPLRLAMERGEVTYRVVRARRTDAPDHPAPPTNTRLDAAGRRICELLDP